MTDNTPTTKREQCEFEFAPGIRCQLERGHDEPYYPYLDHGQWGEYSDILRRGTRHVIEAELTELPSREQWTGKERKDTTSRLRVGEPLASSSFVVSESVHGTPNPTERLRERIAAIYFGTWSHEWNQHSNGVEAGLVSLEAVYDAGWIAALEEAAQIAESSTRPLKGHGTMINGSRSQWYANGVRDAATRIRRSFG